MTDRHLGQRHSFRAERDALHSPPGLNSGPSYDELSESSVYLILSLMVPMLRGNCDPWELSKNKYYRSLAVRVQRGTAMEAFSHFCTDAELQSLGSRSLEGGKTTGVAPRECL